MLRFINFEKTYHHIPVLKIDDLSIKHGVYWLKGANGTGKSTLLKSIAGILHFEGDIFLNGKISLKKDSLTYRRLINFGEAEPVFPEFLSGRDMIKMFVGAKGSGKGHRDDYIEDMQMQSYIDQPLGTYSSGMLKKLSLVLAFTGNPEWILLDEPLITIDVASLDVLYGWILKKHEQDGTSFILASHQSFDGSSLPITAEFLIDQQSLII